MARESPAPVVRLSAAEFLTLGPGARGRLTPVRGVAAVVIERGRLHQPSRGADAGPGPGVPVPVLYDGDLAELEGAEQPQTAALLHHCDAVATGDELDEVIDAVVANPVAAATLTQVLRLGAAVDDRDTHALLAVESFAFASLQGGAEFARWLATQGRRVRRPHDEPAVLISHDPTGGGRGSSRSGTTARLTLNRPRLRNALSAELRDALVEALVAVGHDPDVEAVVIDGAGPAFSIGGDLAEFGTTTDTAEAHQIRMAANVAPALVDLRRPRPGRRPITVTVELHGACVGAGLELAAFADTVRVRPDTTFSLPEVSMGLIPGAGGTVSVPARIGRHRTAALALSGRRIDAATALAWGLADELDETTGPATTARGS